MVRVLKKFAALMLAVAAVFMCAACSKATEGEMAALDRAKQYTETVSLSQERLREQLKSENYSDKEIEYALKKVDVNWYDAAAARAKGYKEFFGLTEEEIREQLEFDQYSYDQIEFAIRKLNK